MADNNLGVVQAEVRLNLAKIQGDANKLTAIVSSAGKQLGKYLASDIGQIHTLTATLQNNVAEMATRGASDIIRFKKTIDQLIKAYGALQKASLKRVKSKDGTFSLVETSASKEYQKTIDSLTVLKGKLDKYEIQQANAHNKKKARLAEEKALLKKQAEEEKKLAKQRKEAEDAYNKSFAGRITNMTKTVATGLLVRSMLLKVISAVKQTIKVTAEYEQKLANTQSVLQSTSAELRSLDNAARRAGETTLFTASQAADALYYMASAGMTANESIQTLDGTLAFAQATGSDLATTAEMMAITLAQFSLKSTESNRVANALTAGIVSSQATLEKYRTSLYQVGPTADASGRSLEEVLGVLNVMYDSGMQASRAGRAMRNVMAELSNESSNTSKKLRKMGIDFKDVDVTTNSLVDVFGNLNDANLSSGQIMQAFGKVIGPQMQVLIRTSREELQRYTDEVTNTNKAFLAAHIQMDTLKSDLTILKSAGEALMISIGKGLTPILRTLVQTGTTVVRFVNAMTKSFQGARSSADVFAEVMTKIKTNATDINRIRTELTDKTNKLTKAERDLYEAQAKSFELEMRKNLIELSKEYENIIKEREKLQKISDASDTAKQQMNAWSEIAVLLGEIQKQEGGATQAQERRLAFLVQRFNDAKTAYRGMADEMKDASFLKGLSNESIKTIKETQRGVQALGATQREVLGYNEVTVQSLLSVAKKDPLMATDFSALYATLVKASAQLADASLDAEVKMNSLDETTQSTIVTYGQLLAEGVTSVEALSGTHKGLLDLILKERDAYNERKNAVVQSTDESYEAVDALRSQLDATDKVSDALAKETEQLLSSAQNSAKAAQSMTLLTKGYASIVNSLHEQKQALEEQIEATRESNLELLSQNENIGAQSASLLTLIANTQADAELRRVRLLIMQQEAQLLIEQKRATEDYNEAEEERIQKLIEAYAKQLEGIDEWEKKVLEAQKNARESAIATAYEEAHTLEAFEDIRAKKISLLEKDKQESLKVLEEEREERIAEQQKTSDETIKEYERERKEKLRIQEDFFKAEQDKADSAFQTANAEALLAQREQTADMEVEYFNRKKAAGENAEELAKAEQYKANRQKEIQREYLDAMKKNVLDKNDAEQKLTKSNADVLVGIEEETNAKIGAERQRFSDWTATVNKRYLTEQEQLLAYYVLQLEQADKEHEALWTAEIERQSKVVAKWAEITAISEAYIEMLDKQKEAVQEARSAELLSLGDVEGAMKLYDEASKKKQENAKKEAEEAYNKAKAEIEAETLTEENEKARADRLQQLKEDYEQSITFIDEYYTNERDTVEKEYNEKAEERIETLSNAWLGLVDSFDAYQDALRSAQASELEDLYDIAIDTGDFVRAKEIRDKLRADELQAERDKVQATYEDAVAAKDKELKEKKISQAEYDEDIIGLDALRDEALNSIREVYNIKERQDEQELAEEKKEFDEEELERKQELYDKELKTIEERNNKYDELYRALIENAKQYEDTLADLDTQQKQSMVEALKGAGDYTQALRLQEELEKATNDRKLADAKAFFAEQRDLNNQTFNASQKTAEDLTAYTTQQEAIRLAEEEANNRILQELAIRLGIVRREVLDEELEYTKQKAEAIQSEFEALVDNIKKYQSSLDSMDTDAMQKQIGVYVDKGEFTKALALQQQLTKQSQDASLQELFTFTNKQREINKKAWEDGTRTYEEYKNQETLITANETASVNLINEKARRENLLSEEEYLEKKKEYWANYVETVTNSILSAFSSVGDLVQAYSDREIEDLERAHNEKMRLLEDELEKKLEIAGVTEETAVEAAERELQEAKATADEKTIIEKEKALKRARIEEEYRANMEKAEKDFAWTKAQLEYKAAEQAWKFDAVTIASQAVVAMSKAIATLNPWVIAATSVASLAQIGKHAVTKPVAPTKADYYATGGIVRGTPEGTAVIAGEKNRPEAIVNPDQMANLLMAIANGGYGGGRDQMLFTLILQDGSSREQARYTVECLNNSVFLLDPNKALKKVSK